MIRDYQAIQKTLFIRGNPKKILTYVKNAGVKLIRTLNYETSIVHCEEYGKVSVKDMIGIIHRFIIYKKNLKKIKKYFKHI